ncbi:FAD-binding oxidoreductase [Aeromicrobium endophyticum]|uniref:FAD-binding oxidoreductase n=1 Tax=Aeromicrobium endophyticum TaxID=2292704 RepID=A0A371P9R2_9ACTN|nr:FAD-binding oxidoreductase [Aeromicrobium endophyticum]
MLGLFTAMELVSDPSVSVEVIDSGHPGVGSSGRSVGMIETQYVDAGDVEVRAFGRKAYSALIDEHALPFVHGGYLRLGHSHDDIAQFERSIAAQAAAGITDAEILLPAEIARRWPQLVTADVSAGLFGAWDGYVDGYEVTQLLARLVRESGGHVRSNSQLVDATRSGSWRLETTNGTFEADVVVNAAGPWAGHVADLLGAPVTLIPQLHGAVAIELPDEKPFTPFVMDYVPGAGSEGVYFRSERKDQLIAGLHTEEVLHHGVAPDVQLGSMDGETVERIALALTERLHDVDDMRIGRSWTGIYPMSSDHRPVVGRHADDPTVVCALGAGGNGIQLSPAIGRMAADAVLERPRSFSDAVQWGQQRFAADPQV